MKTIFWFIGLFGVTCLMRLFGQTPVPYEIPGLGLSDAQLDGDYEHQSKISIGHGYGLTTTAPGTDSWFRSGQEVHIYPETHLRGEVHANIVEYPIHLKWYAPSTTPGVAIRYKKLELGFSLPAGIIAEINNFVNHTGITPTLNPFNPSEVDVFAVFEKRDAAGNWQWYEQINGFYYNEFIRVINDPLDTSAASQYWQKDTTSCPFRIRYAPPQVGEWRVRAFANIIGHTTVYQSAFVMFKVVDTGADPYVRVSSNKRYLQKGNDSFFPIGANISWPDYELASWTTKLVPPVCFTDYLSDIEHYSSLGANYFRMILCPWSQDIEFESVGDYSNRLNRAWEVDRIVEKAEERDMYINFNTLVHYPLEAASTYAYFHWDWYDHTSDLIAPCYSFPWDSGFCYHKDLNLNNPVDFLTDSSAKYFYRNKLRYIAARYGYSTAIISFELISEINNIGMAHSYVNNNGYCYKIEPIISPYRTDYSVRQATTSWHNEMSSFLKSIGLKQLISVNYTGFTKWPFSTDEMYRGYMMPDQSFALNTVDLISYNYYSNEIKRGVKLTENYYENVYNYEKAFIHAELGSNNSPGPDDCDQGATLLIDFFTAAFSGMYGSGMMWNNLNKDSGPFSNRFTVLKNFMSGIDMSDSWFPSYATHSSQKVYANYLIEENFEMRIMGTIVNNTFNWYSMADNNSSSCASKSDDTPNNDFIPGNCQSVDNSVSSNLFIDVSQNPSFNHNGEKYTIEYYDAITGGYIGSSEDKVNTSKLKVNFPSLSGYRPIILFKAYRKNSSFMPLHNENEMVKIQLESDQNVEIADSFLNQPSSKINFFFDVYPNPASMVINIETPVDASEFNYQITDIQGRIVLKGRVSSGVHQVDISGLVNGIYTVVLSSENEYKFIRRLVVVK